MPNRDRKTKQQQHNNMVKEQAKMINDLDYSTPKHRKFLVKSYRQLQKILNKKYKYCCSDEYEGLQYTIVDQILNKALINQPYMFGDPNLDEPDPFYQRTGQSLMLYQAIKYNRYCAQPKVMIDGDLVFDFQNPNISKIQKKQSNIHQCFKNKQFTLTVEVAPNQLILLTTNGKNPVLADAREVKAIKNTYIQTYKPPCVISVAAFNQQFRLHSEVLSIVVIYDEQNGQALASRRQTGMVRPEFDFNLEHSRDNSSVISYINYR